MHQTDAINLIKKGITSNQPQRWADLGCGGGTFTLALAAVLPPGSDILAIDKTQQRLPRAHNSVQIEFNRADFVNDPLRLQDLDGILMANSLHYVEEKTRFLRMLNQPQFIIVEYDTMRTNPWVPHPIAFKELEDLFGHLGYQTTHLAQTPSRFGGRIYAAMVTKKLRLPVD
jgi:ubiquinone/menaquinone biosynthesis C-methylase UbiE